MASSAPLPPGLMEAASRTYRSFHRGRSCPTMHHMHDRNPAEVLPELYRSVLDAVAKLERADERAAAYELRRRAVNVYSKRWNEAGRRGLEKVLRDADHHLATSPRAAALGLAPVSASI
jgi:hypothetical protein